MSGSGTRLTIRGSLGEIDARRPPSYSLPHPTAARLPERTSMRRSLRFAFTLLLARPLTSQADDWQNLFNGNDLTGWKGRPDLWSVKDGAITGCTVDGKIPGGNSFLVWDGTVGDFELKVKF